MSSFPTANCCFGELHCCHWCHCHRCLCCCSCYCCWYADVVAIIVGDMLSVSLSMLVLSLFSVVVAVLFCILFLRLSMSLSFLFLLALFNVQGAVSKHWKPIPPEGCQHQIGRRASNWPKRLNSQMQTTCWAWCPQVFLQRKQFTVFLVFVWHPLQFCINHVHPQVYLKDQLLEMLGLLCDLQVLAIIFPRIQNTFSAPGMGRKFGEAHVKVILKSRCVNIYTYINEKWTWSCVNKHHLLDMINSMTHSMSCFYHPHYLFMEHIRGWFLTGVDDWTFFAWQKQILFWGFSSNTNGSVRVNIKQITSHQPSICLPWTIQVRLNQYPQHPWDWYLTFTLKKNINHSCKVNIYI